MTTKDANARAGKAVLMILAAVIVAGSTARAEEGSSLGVTLDTTYVSKYVWHGYDIFDDHAAIQPSVAVDLFGTGLSVTVWGSIPAGTGSLEHDDGINQ